MLHVARFRDSSRESTSPGSSTSAPTATVCGWRLFSGLKTASTAARPRPNRIEVTARGVLLEAGKPAGDAVLPRRHDAGGKHYDI